MVDDGRPGTLITYFERDPDKEGYAQMGAGQTHHFAFAVASEDEQTEWRIRLNKAGYRVSPIMDRIYFKSIYTNDPDGHIVELATVGPGFPVDEDIATLGTKLMLPPWLEPQRELIHSRDSARFKELFVARVRPRELDILADGSIKQE